MDDWPQKEDDSSQKSPVRAWLSALTQVLLVGLVLTAIVVGYLYHTGRGQAYYIDPTTGSIRATFLGFVVEEYEQRPIERSRLEALCRMPPKIEQQWIRGPRLGGNTYAYMPLTDMGARSGGWDLMTCWHMLSKCAAWADENPEIGRLVLEHLIRYLKGEESKEPLPLLCVWHKSSTSGGIIYEVDKESNLVRFVQKWLDANGYPFRFDEATQKWVRTGP